MIVETVQGEGGLNVARAWNGCRALADLCQRRDMLLIVDDIQMGCGRTGEFFILRGRGHHARHRHGVQVDQRLRPADGADPVAAELDVWAPGGTTAPSRGHNPAFVTATAKALGTYSRKISEFAVVPPP